jgi:acetylornithine deacetylase/succinyl-diaminopimelate desuccinylase-like protein
MDRHVRDLAELVAIPSISTDPDHAGDVARAIDWVARRLRRAGIEHVDVWKTSHHPAVYGRWDAAPGAPTVLIYGHADVQPPDPIELWKSPPFELTERDGRWYARGISDDKASMLLPILAAESCFAAHTPPPVNLRFLIEAEEEIGSPSIATLLKEHRDQLACDLVLSADGGMWRADSPCVRAA